MWLILVPACYPLVANHPLNFGRAYSPVWGARPDVAVRHASGNPVCSDHIQRQRLTTIPRNLGFCEESLGEFFYDKNSDEVRLVERRAWNCARHDHSTHTSISSRSTG